MWPSKSSVLALVAACLAIAVASFLVHYRLTTASTGQDRAAGQQYDDRAGTPCTTPGPTLAARIANLDLAGLTVIPITRLPRLRKRVRVWHRTVTIYADLTASELVFRRLRVGQVTTRSRDVGREPIQVTADGVEIDLTGSIGIRAGFYYEDDDVKNLGEKGAGGHEGRRGWSCRGSGRVHVALNDASTLVTTRLVRRPVSPKCEHAESRPGLQCREIEFSPGSISLLSLSGFVPFLRLEALAHYFRNTPLARAATRRFAAFMVTEVLHGPVCSDSLRDLEHFIEKHVDLETWSTVADAERDEVLKRFFNDSVTAGHSGETLNDGSTAQFTTSTSPTTKSTSLRLHALIYGSLHLHSFALPVATDGVDADGTTQVPVFARRDQTGLRYSLLSNPILNQLTRGPPDVSFGPSTFEKVAFREASIELEPDPIEVLEGNLGLASPPPPAATNSRPSDPASSTPAAPARTRARELVLRVNGLVANLSIGFRIGAELRRAPALVSGMRILEEKGVATTEIAEAVTELGRGKRQWAQEKRNRTTTDEYVDEETEGEREGSLSAAPEAEEGIAIRLPLRWDRTTGRVYLTSRHDDDNDDLAVVPDRPGSIAALTNSHRRQGSRGGPNARGIRLEGTFGTVAPRVRLESRLGKLLGERVVNALLEGVQVRPDSARGQQLTCFWWLTVIPEQTHLAALTIPLASHFLADLARQRLQRALDSVSERLATEGGVLWTPAAELERTPEQEATRIGHEKAD